MTCRTEEKAGAAKPPLQVGLDWGDKTEGAKRDSSLRSE